MGTSFIGYLWLNYTIPSYGSTIQQVASLSLVYTKSRFSPPEPAAIQPNNGSDRFPTAVYIILFFPLSNPGARLEEIAKKEIEDRLIEFYNAYYTDQINDMYVAYPQKRAILVNMKDLEKFDSELANELLNNPDMILPNANSALTQAEPAPGGARQAGLREVLRDGRRVRCR